MRVPRHMLHCRGCGRVYYASAADVAAANDLRCECGLPVRHVVPRREEQPRGPEPVEAQVLEEAPIPAHDVAPAQPAPDEFGEYEIAGDPAEDARPVLAAVAPRQSASVLPYRPAAQEVVDPSLYFPNPGVDLYAPAALLLLGAGIGLGELMYLYDDVWKAVSFGTAYLVVKLLMLLICIPLLTRLAGVSFGTLPSAALKLTAIAILPEAVGMGVMLLGGGCLGALLAMPVSFIASWTMFAKLFDLDIIESRLCAVVYWGVGLAFGFAWASLLGWLLGLLW